MQSYAIGLHSQHGWVHSTTIMKHQSPVLWQVFDRLVVDFPGSGLTCMSKLNGFKKFGDVFCDLPKKHQRNCNPLWDGWSFDIICIDNELSYVFFMVSLANKKRLLMEKLQISWGWNRRALQSSEPECHTSRTCPSFANEGFWKARKAFENNIFFLNPG